MDAESEGWLRDLQSDVPALCEASWERLFGLARRVAYLICRGRNITPSQAWLLAEDIAQEALIDIMRKLPTFKGRSRFTTWVYSCVRLNALELLRKFDSSRQRSVSLDGDEASSLLEIIADPMESGPEPEAEEADLIRATQEIINTRLTERQRRVLLLNVAGYSRTLLFLELNLYTEVIEACSAVEERARGRGITRDVLLARRLAALARGYRRWPGDWDTALSLLRQVRAMAVARGTALQAQQVDLDIALLLLEEGLSEQALSLAQAAARALEAYPAKMT
ncbi:MAG: RNA polymerase sigma factor [Chloroflexia bacterium]